MQYDNFSTNCTTCRNRTRKEVSSAFYSKTKESPLSIYIGALIHAKTKKKDLVDKLYKLGISIPYLQVLELSTTLGNDVLSQYDQDRVVCPLSLKKKVFTTAALDNIDHNPSSMTAEGSFHGTGISLFQHISKNEPGNTRESRTIHSTKMLHNYWVFLLKLNQSHSLKATQIIPIIPTFI